MGVKCHSNNKIWPYCSDKSRSQICFHIILKASVSRKMSKKKNIRHLSTYPFLSRLCSYQCKQLISESDFLKWRENKVELNLNFTIGRYHKGFHRLHHRFSWQLEYYIRILTQSQRSTKVRQSENGAHIQAFLI